KLIDELFDRLRSLEGSPRDPEAERLIRDGLRRAPNAVYALVQTVLLQDEALKRADAQMRGRGDPADEPRPTAADRHETRASVPEVPARSSGGVSAASSGGSAGRRAGLSS